MVEADDEFCLGFDGGGGQVAGDVREGFGAEVPWREDVVDDGGDVGFGVTYCGFGRFCG